MFSLNTDGAVIHRLLISTFSPTVSHIFHVSDTPLSDNKIEWRESCCHAYGSRPPSDIYSKHVRSACRLHSPVGWRRSPAPFWPDSLQNRFSENDMKTTFAFSSKVFGWNLFDNISFSRDSVVRSSLCWSLAKKEYTVCWPRCSPYTIYTPGDKKHEPSKLNYYTFGAELRPLGINSLSFP